MVNFGELFFSMKCLILAFRRWALDPDHWGLKSALSLSSYNTLSKFLNLPIHPLVPHP